MLHFILFCSIKIFLKFLSFFQGISYSTQCCVICKFDKHLLHPLCIHGHTQACIFFKKELKHELCGQVSQREDTNSAICSAHLQSYEPLPQLMYVPLALIQPCYFTQTPLPSCIAPYNGSNGADKRA